MNARPTRTTLRFDCIEFSRSGRRRRTHSQLRSLERVLRITGPQHVETLLICTRRGFYVYVQRVSCWCCNCKDTRRSHDKMHRIEATALHLPHSRSQERLSIVRAEQQASKFILYTAAEWQVSSLFTRCLLLSPEYQAMEPK